MYFALAHIMNAFCYLKYGLAGILTFVGIKMIVADLYHLDVLLSLTIIVIILGMAIAASLIKNRRDAKHAEPKKAEREQVP